MSEIIMGQVRFLLVMLCLGMALICGYDLFRFLRWLVPHHKVVIWAEDILYWSLVSIPVYAVFFLYNNGEIRWYGVLAVILGGLLYEGGISRMLSRFGRRYLEKPKRRFLGFLSKIKRHFSVRKMLRKVEIKKKKQLQKSGK
ncbi:MAG: hypothetical protein HFH73_11825 [Lachnospiraceae bacterium]|nr:hypothetical protein [Lachnospiraceae bacterium]